jgi:hypothetical protein
VEQSALQKRRYVFKTEENNLGHLKPAIGKTACNIHIYGYTAFISEGRVSQHYTSG